MHKIKISFLSLILLISILGIGFFGSNNNVAMAASDGYALVDAVNQLRAANGLYTLRYSGSLMGSAQGQSNYQASIGTWTHSGPGGSDVTQRVAAAGYGSGARILCDECVAYGYKYSPQDVINQWKDATHWNIMMSARFVDAGGGVTTAGDGDVYYTLDVCYVVGSTSISLPGKSAGNIDSISGTPQPTSPPIYAVETVTPQPDGSIVHIVREGQTLTSIADAYGVSLADLMALNYYTKEAVIYVGQKVLIKKAGPPTPSATVTPTITTTHQPTPTHRPTRTATLPISTRAAAPMTTVGISTPVPSRLGLNDLVGKLLLAATALLGVLGVGFIVAGSVLKRSS